MRRIREFISTIASLGFLIFLAIIFSFAVASVAVWLIDRPPSIPNENKAPYKVLTASRIYFSDNVIGDGDITYLHGYYTFERGKWRFKKEILPLGPEFGPVEVKMRQGNEKD